VLHAYHGRSSIHLPRHRVLGQTLDPVGGHSEEALRAVPLGPDDRTSDHIVVKAAYDQVAAIPGLKLLSDGLRVLPGHRLLREAHGLRGLWPIGTAVNSDYEGHLERRRHGAQFMGPLTGSRVKKYVVLGNAAA
jgi:hypothetical protein